MRIFIFAFTGLTLTACGSGTDLYGGNGGVNVDHSGSGYIGNVYWNE